MGVEVRRYRELRVPKDLYHHSRGDVLCERWGSAGVPKVVNADAANASLFDELIEQTGQVAPFPFLRRRWKRRLRLGKAACTARAQGLLAELRRWPAQPC
jgi:hypothetical protein